MTEHESSEALSPRESFVLALFDAGMIHFGGLHRDARLPEGATEAPKSTIDFNLSKIRSFPDLVTQVVGLLVEKGRNIPHNAVVDIPTRVTPVTSVYMTTTRKPMLSPGKSKGYGIPASVIGMREELRGKPALVIEDVTTTGASVLQQVPLYRLYRSEGSIICDALVIIDRQQGAKEALAKEGVTLHALYTQGEILALLLRENKISQEQYEAASADITE